MVQYRPQYAGYEPHNVSLSIGTAVKSLSDHAYILLFNHLWVCTPEKKARGRQALSTRDRMRGVGVLR